MLKEEFRQTDEGSFVKISPMIVKTKYPDPSYKSQKSYASSNSSRSERSRRSKRKGTSLKTKALPPNFAEHVLNLELIIDQGNFNMDTINELLLLYSQAVEFYDGMNDEKHVTYEARIQNMLIKPEINAVMKAASRDPEGYAKKEAEKKKIAETQSRDEILKAKAKEQDRLKKERG